MLRGEGVYVKGRGFMLKSKRGYVKGRVGIYIREGDMLRGGADMCKGGVSIVISLISNRSPH